MKQLIWAILPVVILISFAWQGFGQEETANDDIVYARKNIVELESLFKSLNLNELDLALYQIKKTEEEVFESPDLLEFIGDTSALFTIENPSQGNSLLMPFYRISDDTDSIYKLRVKQSRLRMFNSKLNRFHSVANLTQDDQKRNPSEQLELANQLKLRVNLELFFVMRKLYFFESELDKKCFYLQSADDLGGAIKVLGKTVPKTEAITALWSIFTSTENQRFIEIVEDALVCKAKPYQARAEISTRLKKKVHEEIERKISNSISAFLELTLDQTAQYQGLISELEGITIDSKKIIQLQSDTSATQNNFELVANDQLELITPSVSDDGSGQQLALLPELEQKANTEVPFENLVRIQNHPEIEKATNDLRTKKNVIGEFFKKLSSELQSLDTLATQNQLSVDKCTTLSGAWKDLQETKAQDRPLQYERFNEQVKSCFVNLNKLLESQKPNEQPNHDVAFSAMVLEFSQKFIAGGM